GLLTARKHSDAWFQVDIALDQSMNALAAHDIVTAIQWAFAFVLGRQVVCRGFLELSDAGEVRQLLHDRRERTHQLVPAPLGNGLAYREHVESLLACAVPFFASDDGRAVAYHLGVCWDSADNQFATQVAIGSIALEGLVVCCPTSDVDPGFTENDRDALRTWLADQRGVLSTGFLNRVEGFVSTMHTR